MRPSLEEGAHAIGAGEQADQDVSVEQGDVSACPGWCRFGIVDLAVDFLNFDFETAVLGRNPTGGDFFSRVRWVLYRWDTRPEKLSNPVGRFGCPTFDNPLILFAAFSPPGTATFASAAGWQSAALDGLVH